MGRSHQKGWVVARGKKWYGYFRRTVLDPVSNQPKGNIVPIVLGLKTQFTKLPRQPTRTSSRKTLRVR